MRSGPLLCASAVRPFPLGAEEPASAVLQFPVSLETPVPSPFSSLGGLALHGGLPQCSCQPRPGSAPQSGRAYEKVRRAELSLGLKKVGVWG